MYVVEIFLPTAPPELAVELANLRVVLTEKFSGFTAFTRAPAHGAWRADTGHVEHDEVIVIEVMTNNIERVWWAELRDRLQAALKQKEILVRAYHVEQL